jgi:hypothetical protein
MEYIRALAIVFINVAVVEGQPIPFFPAGATAFDPEISVLTTGILNDVQGIVSQDRKYVTINAQPSNSRLIEMRQFPVSQSTGLGFVGLGTVSAAANGATAPAGSNRGVTLRLNAPTATASILFKEGMTRLPD